MSIDDAVVWASADETELRERLESLWASGRMNRDALRAMLDLVTDPPPVRCICGQDFHQTRAGKGWLTIGNQR